MKYINNIFYNFLIIATVLSFGSAKVINYNKIDKNLYAIKLINSKNSTLISKNIKYLSNETLYVAKSKKWFTIYIVNIQNKKLAKQKQKKYKKLYRSAKITNIFKKKKQISKKRYKKVKKIRKIRKIEKIKKVKKVKKIKFRSNKELKRAISLYNSGKFNKANIILNRLYQKDLNNKKINLYLARTNIELKNYDIATAAIERLLIADENDLDAKFEMGRVLYDEDDYSRAKDMFVDVRLRSEDIKQKKLSQEYIRKINNRLNRHKFYIDGSIGVFYDDNVKNINNLLEKINIPDGEPIYKEAKDIGYKGSLFLSYIFNLTSDTKITNTVGYLNKTYKTFEEFNNNALIYRPILSMMFSDKYLAKLKFSYTSLDKNSTSYLTTKSISPELKYYFSKDISLTGYWQYQTTSYDINSSLDNSINKFETTLLINFKNSKINVKASLAKQKNSQNIKMLNNSSINYLILYEGYFIDKIILALHGRYILTTYDEQLIKDTIMFGNIKELEEFIYGLKASYYITKHLSVSVDYKNITVSNNTNLSIGYRKNIINTSIKFNY